MSLRSAIVSRVTQHITGEQRLEKQRAKAEAARKRSGAPHMIDYFHQTDDPYSHLMLQILPALRDDYGVEITPWLVPPPPDDAAPDRDRLISHSREDAARLAGKAGLDFRDPGCQPDPDDIRAANAKLAALISAGTFVDEALNVSTALWQGVLSHDPAPLAPDALTDALLEKGAARREELGHYLGGTLHYGGEWYWGPDRLCYLEDRLRELGLGDQKRDRIYEPPMVPSGGHGGPATGADLHWYCSFRSPYTYLAAERVKALADAYGAQLQVRFVLPMVMRGLAVPRRKGRYILTDVAREARRLGVPFGKISDPVGKPVERAYSIFPYAIERGRAYEFARAFLTHVWTMGTDAGTDPGLRKIVEMAGLDWDTARGLIGSDAWKAIEEANQQELLSYGQWGVPSFRVGDVITWGQDRLWVIEDELKRLRADATQD